MSKNKKIKDLTNKRLRNLRLKIENNIITKGVILHS